jgi:hypothetical protein
MNFADCVRDRGRRNGPTDTPSCDAIALGETVDCNGSLSHPVESRDGNMLCIFVQDVFVNFVRDGQHIELNAEVANQFEFLAAENLAVDCSGCSE